MLDDISNPTPSELGESIGAGLAATINLEAGQIREVVFALSWDMPMVRSGYGTAYRRRYSVFYGDSGNSAQKIAADAIQDYQKWDKEISHWQSPILEDEKLPAWFRTALFNELYYIVDGGTLWAYPQGQKVVNPGKDMGHFAYLEGHEYAMFNTYDVHFYASFALVMNWPRLGVESARGILPMQPLRNIRMWSKRSLMEGRAKKGARHGSA